MFYLVRKQRERLTKSKVDISVTCNKCGKAAKRDYDGDYTQYADTLWDGEFKSFEVHWGYMSKYDMETWEFDLCQDCLWEITKSFIIPMNQNQYI